MEDETDLGDYEDLKEVGDVFKFDWGFVMSIHNLSRLDDALESMRLAGRIPGIAIGVVVGGELQYAKGFGYRDLEARLPMTADTIYPIASTAKAFNSTLLGMLVDEGLLDWGRPVQEYLPRFLMGDLVDSTRITIRDMLSMQTGLPLHEYVWIENPINRSELVERLRHLPLSAGFRERFQYSDLTPTVAGHVAEVVTSRSWENLVDTRILRPLHMRDTGFSVPLADRATHAYHEGHDRQLVRSERKAVDLIAPAGGSIHSTIVDMGHWIAFNLNKGSHSGGQLIASDTLQELQSPRVVMGADATAPSVLASYGMGWFVDTYMGSLRVSHTGLLYDVNSCVSLHPREQIGIVSFSNFASFRPALLMNQLAFELLMGFSPQDPFTPAIARYESGVANMRKRTTSVKRIAGSKPSHALDAYCGVFEHQGYGRICIECAGEGLVLRRNELVLPLDHWHFDAWVAAENNRFEIHKPHAFDRTSRLVFQMCPDGTIESVDIALEPATAPIRFRRC